MPGLNRRHPIPFTGSSSHNRPSAIRRSDGDPLPALWGHPRPSRITSLVWECKPAIGPTVII